MKSSISAVMFGTVALQYFAAADSVPCSATSAACCNPNSDIAEFCPGGIACEDCGAGACECPSAPAPGPSPAPGPVSLSRLTIVNGCNSSPMWIAHIAGGDVGPDEQDVKISPGQQAKFLTATNGGLGGLTATRYWPKMGCDSTGNDCSIGDSGGPAEGCVIRIPNKDDNYTQCAPPVDSKFEATFAAPLDTAAGARDVVDMSLVDGYTLPFKLETSGGSCQRGVTPFESLDCSELSLSQCPTSETLGSSTRDLRAVNPKTGELAGCYSPCKKLTDDKWNETMPEDADSKDAGPYCCAGSYGTPDKCSAGPVMQTNYLPSVKATCPYAYAYPYDDHIATIACTTSTEYVVTFYCPSQGTDQLAV